MSSGREKPPAEEGKVRRSQTRRCRGGGAGIAAGFRLDHRDVVVVLRFRIQELAGEAAGENEV